MISNDLKSRYNDLREEVTAVLQQIMVDIDQKVDLEEEHIFTDMSQNDVIGIDPSQIFIEDENVDAGYLIEDAAMQDAIHLIHLMESHYAKKHKK